MRKLLKYVIDYHELLGFIAAILGAISFLPQVLKTWRSRTTKGISSLMYIVYGISILLWLAYGLIIKSTPLILAEIFTLILVSLILIMKYIWK